MSSHRYEFIVNIDDKPIYISARGKNKSEAERNLKIRMINNGCACFKILSSRKLY